MLRKLFITVLAVGLILSTQIEAQSQEDWLTAKNQPSLKVRQNPAILDNTAEEKIQNLIALAVNGAFDESWNASIQLAALGDVVVPYMVPFLADEREDLHRTQIIVVLKKVGSQAVLPLLQAIQTKDYFLQQNISIVLREIEDPRAIGYLRWLTESPDASTPDVAPYAQQALQVIPGGIGGSAKQAFFSQGTAYYNQTLINTALTPHNLWRYNSEKDTISAIIVPEEAYFAALAEETCHRALEIEPEDQNVWALLVCSYMKQYIATRNIGALGEEAEISDEAKASYKMVEKAFVKKKVLGSSAGINYLMAGLNLAMENNQPDVGVEILDAIGEVATEQDLKAGNAVYKALKSKHQMLRYASARALVQINPKRTFSGAERVIPNLVEALGSQEVSDKASKSLASIDPARSVFNASGAVSGLISLLKNPNKEIKISTIRALGQTGSSKALASLAKVLSEKSEDAEVRADAAWAIGEIFKTSGQIESQAYDALIRGIRDSNQEVKNQSGLAMGKATRLEPRKRFSLFLAERQGEGGEESESEEEESEEEESEEEESEEEESEEEESEEEESEEEEDDMNEEEDDMDEEEEDMEDEDE